MTRRAGAAEVAAAGGALFTLAVAAVPWLRFAYENLLLHVALETGEGMIALLLAYLAVGRLRLTGHRSDVLLAWSFAVFGVSNLIVAGMLVSAAEERSVGFATWFVVGLRLGAAAAFCASALAHRSDGAGRPTPPANVAAATALVVVVAASLALAAAAGLGEVIDPELSPEASNRPVIAGHGLVVSVQSIATLLFGVAAVAFAREATRRPHDSLLRWLAAGTTLHAFARFNYVLFPSLYSNWVYAGDVLRLAGWLLYLVGAGREITDYFRARAEVAVLEERRRMARELHDGLTQELAFMRSQLASLASGSDPADMLGHVAAAAERAERESRRAVDALAGSDATSPDDVLQQVAADVASMTGATVTVQGRVVPMAQGGVDALARILREASLNAVRHGGARTVVARLESPAGGGWVRLVVVDDGRGFAPERVADGAGFGLRSMRERAEQLGGRFSLTSTPGRGTTVEVELPRGAG